MDSQIKFSVFKHRNYQERKGRILDPQIIKGYFNQFNLNKKKELLNKKSFNSRLSNCCEEYNFKYIQPEYH